MPLARSGGYHGLTIESKGILSAYIDWGAACLLILAFIYLVHSGSDAIHVLTECEDGGLSALPVNPCWP